MRIALLSMLCLVACVGPGLEPPERGDNLAGAGGLSGSGGGGAGAGGTGAGAGGAAGLGTGGGDSRGGGMSGGLGGTGGAVTGGQGGASPHDAGMTDSGSDGGDIVIDESRDLDTGWSDACGSVTHNGHCAGAVFEYCDYYSRGLKQLDCGELGMTCQAGLQPGDGVQTNGCVGAPCTAQDERCEDNLRVDCRDGQLLVTDCHKTHGPASTCELFEENIRCATAEPCDTPSVLWCDRELKVICDEESTLHVVDCQGHAEDGRCVVAVGGDPYCEPRETE